MRNHLELLLLVALFTLASPSCDAATADARPNILFIMSDDHAAQAISCYGSKINQTPNLDRLAKEGMRFANCFCTNAVCGPSRAVILTGKYSHLNGFARNGNVFDGSQQTVAKLLQKAGYQTAIVGKWHLESLPTGFDDWQILYGQGPYYNPRMRTPKGPVPYSGYTTDIITDIVLDYLEHKRDKSKPFFLMYHHKAPHRNWMPAPEMLHKYDGQTMPEPETLFDDYTGRGTAAHKADMRISTTMNDEDLKLAEPKGLTPEQARTFREAYASENEAFRKAGLSGRELVSWKYQRYIKDYVRCVDSVDKNVGRVLDYLDRSGLARNTIVIYTSDQGFYLGEHGWFDKRFMYEESLRMPLLVRWPGHIQAGSTSDRMVLNLDFAETFLDCAGAAIPSDMQGQSVKPILEGNPPADWRTAMYYRYYEYPAVHMVAKHYGIRTDRYKLIRYHELGEWELFDLEKDPDEMTSVYSDPAYADVVRRLKGELEQLKKSYRDDDTVAVRR